MHGIIAHIVGCLDTTLLYEGYYMMQCWYNRWQSDSLSFNQSCYVFDHYISTTCHIGILSNECWITDCEKKSWNKKKFLNTTSNNQLKSTMIRHHADLFVQKMQIRFVCCKTSCYCRRFEYVAEFWSYTYAWISVWLSFNIAHLLQRLKKMFTKHFPGIK
jgi:hypothetical protein